MEPDNINLIKKVIAKELNSFDFNKEIQKHEESLSKLQETPADEYSFSGNIEYGIANLLNTATTISHPIGYLTAKKSSLIKMLELLDKNEDELKSILNDKVPESESKSSKDDLINRLKSVKPPKRKHFFECKLTNKEEWGSKNCVCPGAYIYRKYLSLGLTEIEAKLISDYTQLDDLMEDKERYKKGKALYNKYKFLNVSELK